ncbi:hypothetical protein Esti_001861 [Eimeria stiedai]
MSRWCPLQRSRLVQVNTNILSGLLGCSSMPGQHANELAFNLLAAPLQNPALHDHDLQPSGFTKTKRLAAIPVECWKFRSKVLPKLSNASKLIAINAFGLLLMFFFVSICQAIKNNVVEGVHGRRLAEVGDQDDGDLSPPSTPELVHLCIELEAELGPGQSSTEVLRASPSMVEAFFDDLGGGEGPTLEAGPADLAGSLFEESQTPPSSSFRKKRPRSGDREDAPAGSIWKRPAEKRATAPPTVLSGLSATKELSSFSASVEAVRSPPRHHPSIQLEGHSSVNERFPHAFRGSPLMVQAFFDELEGHIGSEPGLGPADMSDSALEGSQTPLVSSLSKKRPASGEEGDEIVGPSWKVAKKDTYPASLVSSIFPEAEKSLQVSGADSVAIDNSHSHVSSSSPDYSWDAQEFLQFLESTLEQSESSSVSPSSGALPSSAEAPVDAFSAPPGDGHIAHPWVQVPALEPGATARPFWTLKQHSRLVVHNHSRLLLRMRELLRKPVLNQNDINGLIMYAEFLVIHAMNKMTTLVRARRPADAAEGLARRFLVFYMLHLTSKAVRRRFQQETWWRDFANAIPTGCPYTPEARPITAANEHSIRLAMRLSAALELYKNGSAPGDREVVAIMRKLFCSVLSPYHLRKKVWDPWRRDDESSSSNA